MHLLWATSTPKAPKGPGSINTETLVTQPILTKKYQWILTTFRGELSQAMPYKTSDQRHGGPQSELVCADPL